MLGNVDVSYCWRPQTVRAALVDFVTFIVQSYFDTSLRYVLLHSVEQLRYWRLWTKRHSGRAGEVMRCVYMYTVTVQNTWNICQAAVHKSLTFSLIAIPHPRATTFSLGSLLTNRKYTHSQKASWNDFRGLLGLSPCVLPLRAPFLLAPITSKRQCYAKLNLKDKILVVILSHKGRIWVGVVTSI